VNVLTQEWSVYLDNQKNHRFDMFVGSWAATPVPDDPKQIFHTESYNGGSNYVGFGDDKSDALIDSIRIELDEPKRNVLYKRLQQVLHDEVPYIFLFAPTERIAIHNRFSNADASVMRPGYWEAGFSVGSAAPAVTKK
jgi:peptide/nickel transport system substrate-binding protein